MLDLRMLDLRSSSDIKYDNSSDIKYDNSSDIKYDNHNTMMLI